MEIIIHPFLILTHLLWYFTVRSIASVNIRKMYHVQSNIKFDFFTVDLNEEYSAVFGGVLPQQTEFVSQCINTIIKIYQPDYKPTSIILIGHSMVTYYI